MLLTPVTHSKLVLSQVKSIFSLNTSLHSGFFTEKNRLEYPLFD
jgi:hypothetical protein